MMNEIILNGVSSTELKGLIIQTLPPITKPAIRAEIEEIDGRDGDIVTKLGYAAYDKTFSIGLSYDYNIDEIISYFNTSGTVIFSNEDDKYYNYEILGAIDFERLIRFKTAVVTMHVQPFKYSAVEAIQTFNVNSNLVVIDDFSETRNGITLSVEDDEITISGTGTDVTEFYVPIKRVNLDIGNSYTLYAYSAGINPQVCNMRLIYESPSDDNSFGGTDVMLENDNIVTISADMEEDKTYNYLYFSISAGTVMDFSINVDMHNNVNETVAVRNNGNYISRPTMAIVGEGTINVSLNNNQIFVIELGNEESIIIDTENMEATNTNGILRNRLVTGNYENFVLNPGKNEISFTGIVTYVLIKNFSRWI